MKATLVLLLSLILCAAAIKAPKDEFRKKLAGPPSEFSQFKIPSPVSAALSSSSAFQSIVLTADKNQGFSWTGTFPVDSTSQFSLGLFSPYADSFEIVVTPPNSLRTYLHKLPLDSAEPVKRTGPFGIDGASYPVTTWTWSQPIAGTWNAEIKCATKVDSSTIKAMLLLYNESPLQVFSHLNTYDLQVGQEVGVVANLYDSRFAELDSTGRPTPMILSSGSLKAQMDVTFPDGKEFVLQMHDDGLHKDLAANDGVYGAVLQAAEVGAYTAQAVFTGVTPSGQQFIRSTDHLFNVVEPLVTLTGLATAEMKDQNTIVFHLDVDVLDPSLVDSLTVKAFAEVWGTDQSGLEYVPVAWLQAMVDPHRFQNDVVVSLQMDKNWMHIAQASAPLQLRNVWLEDREYATPFSERSNIFVDIPASSKLRQFRPSPYMKNIAITKEMREGPKPLSRRNATAANPKLILVHGYCAGENEFPLSQFTNAVQFTDFKQSRTNEAFALRINQFAESQGITSFGIVGHSQGGLAATHLHTYYNTGLDEGTGGTLVQSVGSPYGGSGLAGGLASIGGIFGVGCGSNTDLSRDGATRWRAAIPPANAKNVDFYTTIYGSQGYCAWGANMVLALPNDGTTEIDHASLPGANNKGTTNNWCHTTGMTYANQCTDPARNAILNKNAAR